MALIMTKDDLFSPSVIGQFIYGNVKERRRWDQAIPLRCHGPFESWAVIGPLIPNKHGGANESNKAFENKCYLLYEINIFRINNSRVRKVIHGRLSAWPAGSHRLVSCFPGSAKASPGNQEGDSPAGSAGPADNRPWIPLFMVAPLWTKWS